jgi:hypothetical protein
MDESFTPVPYDCREVIQEQMSLRTEGKVFFFKDGKVDEASGSISKQEEVPGKGTFIFIGETPVRIDMIITLFGKPGAAYDRYDAFANACLDCKGGYDL